MNLLDADDTWQLPEQGGRGGGQVVEAGGGEVRTESDQGRDAQERGANQDEASSSHGGAAPVEPPLGRSCPAKMGAVPPSGFGQQRGPMGLDVPQ